ncbi:hypothetical protein BDV34DRAFT_1402 [Aspergillus parasiticus]|uniref:Uncharacterized protein n=1 Tax=Aspergillus parasiticus TaxID=5067 RepID=A0A5N6E4D3_ASPPA|nr:hypothetical protein BDV34DRAFT_1402 [Aspergillus parasiticus]
MKIKNVFDEFVAYLFLFFLIFRHSIRDSLRWGVIFAFFLFLFLASLFSSRAVLMRGNCLAPQLLPLVWLAKWTVWRRRGSWTYEVGSFKGGLGYN